MASPTEKHAAVVLVTVPDLETGRKLARAVLEERLAACVNVVPGVTSLYRWKGALEESAELLLVVKTTRGRLAGLERRVRELHPYSVPEFVALEPAHVAAPYLAWLAAETDAGA
jgi:periplasmic divalent cation tolerance protein